MGLELEDNFAGGEIVGSRGLNKDEAQLVGHYNAIVIFVAGFCHPSQKHWILTLVLTGCLILVVDVARTIFSWANAI